MPHHIDVGNPETFEVKDLEKLIMQVSFLSCSASCIWVYFTWVMLSSDNRSIMIVDLSLNLSHILILYSVLICSAMFGLCQVSMEG